MLTIHHLPKIFSVFAIKIIIIMDTCSMQVHVAIAIQILEMFENTVYLFRLDPGRKPGNVAS